MHPSSLMAIFILIGFCINLYNNSKLSGFTLASWMHRFGCTTLILFLALFVEIMIFKKDTIKGGSLNDVVGWTLIFFLFSILVMTILIIYRLAGNAIIIFLNYILLITIALIGFAFMPIRLTLNAIFGRRAEGANSRTGNRENYNFEEAFRAEQERKWQDQWEDREEDEEEDNEPEDDHTGYQQSGRPSWSITLEVSPDADAQTVKSAYRRLIKKYHPDAVATKSKKVQASHEAKMKEINAAYDLYKMLQS